MANIFDGFEEIDYKKIGTYTNKILDIAAGIFDSYIMGGSHDIANGSFQNYWEDLIPYEYDNNAVDIILTEDIVNVDRAMKILKLLYLHIEYLIENENNIEATFFERNATLKIEIIFLEEDSYRIKLYRI